MFNVGSVRLCDDAKANRFKHYPSWDRRTKFNDGYASEAAGAKKPDPGFGVRFSWSNRAI